MFFVCLKLKFILFLNNLKTAVFRKHGRILVFRIVGDEEMKTQAGSFSRSGLYHYISISKNMFERAFTNAHPGPMRVCGGEFDNRLECLVRVLEHELCHLIGEYWSKRFDVLPDTKFCLLFVILHSVL